MLGATMVVATLPVSDLERAGAFYGETLGVTRLWDNPASIRFRCGDTSELSVFRRPGLTTEHTLAQMGPARGAWFRDPDGNFLGLRQG